MSRSGECDGMVALSGEGLGWEGQNGPENF